MHAAEARLSRFRPDSELCALNADPRAVVPASALLRAAVRAALRAAELSRGLVDPCLLDALEAAGYRRSLARDRDAPAVPDGPARPARPHPAARWREVRVDDRAGTVVRPPGLRLDLGGSGKGFIADRVAALLPPAAGWVVDAGGDVRLGGTHEVLVAHPLRPEPAARLRLRDTAVATSSVVARAWRTPDGSRAHHLLDPSTGAPAWTGVLSATAIAPSVLEAETLAKAALLSGPVAGRRLLAARGGLLVLADGAVEPIPGGPA